MEIRVYSEHYFAEEYSIHMAFLKRPIVEEVMGEKAYVVLFDGKRDIKLEKEHPQYRVRVYVPFVPMCEIGFDYFATLEDAMKRVEEAYGLGFFVDLEKYRTYQNGVRRWVPVG